MRVSLVGLALLFASSSLAGAVQPQYGQLSLTLENDLTSATDRNYTSGARLGFISAPVGEAGIFGGLDAWLDRQTGPGALRWGIGLQQGIFTPAWLSTPTPDPRDRPYAGTLAGTASLVHTLPFSESRITAEFGVIGPGSIAKQTQDWVHAAIGSAKARGWATQLQNRADLGVVLDNRWRVGLPEFLGLPVQFIPAVGGSIGTVNSWIGAGGMLRVGSAAALAADFGPQRITPGLSAAPALAPPEEFAWYAFLGVQGRLVARDLTLDGYDGQGVTRRNAVGEVEAGVALFWRGLRLSFLQVLRSSEFVGQGGLADLYKRQRGGPVSFGSVTLTIPF